MEEEGALEERSAASSSEWSAGDEEPSGSDASASDGSEGEGEEEGSLPEGQQQEEDDEEEDQEGSSVDEAAREKEKERLKREAREYRDEIERRGVVCMCLVGNVGPIDLLDDWISPPADRLIDQPIYRFIHPTHVSPPMSHPTHGTTPGVPLLAAALYEAGQGEAPTRAVRARHAALHGGGRSVHPIDASQSFNAK